MSAEQYGKIFDMADGDGSGELTAEELGGFLRKNGYNKSDDEIRAMFESVDFDASGKITKQEFLEAMGVQPPKLHMEAVFRRIFNDLDADGSGTISRENLTEVYEQAGKSISEAEVNRIMELADADGSGTINYDEFMRACYPPE